jgi:hypothetical protein
LVEIEGFFFIKGLFITSFDVDGFYFVDPNAGNPNPKNDRPPRLWVKGYLAEVSENQVSAEHSFSAVVNRSQNPWIYSWLVEGNGCGDDFGPNNDIRLVIKK